MQKNFKERYGYTQNRELSWLRFDRRVLEEAADASLPVLERLKFISIFASNLDEFFMVRVGSLFDIARITPDNKEDKTGWTAEEQLKHIYDAVPELLEMKKRIYADVMSVLLQSGIQDIYTDVSESSELKLIGRFFRSEMLPILSPILIGANHPVPHLVNKHLYAAALLENKKGHKAIGIVPVPDSLPPYLMLPDRKRYIRTENILLHWLPTLFGAYTVMESCVIAVTRNADISFDEEKFDDNEDDFRYRMKKLLKQRDHLAVVRLELSRHVSAEFVKLLSSTVKVEPHRIFTDTCPLNMKYVFALINDLPEEISGRLLYTPYEPRHSAALQQGRPMIGQIQQRDRLLFYPYDSVEPFLQLLNEAADNPQVLSIKITIYRLASSSKIAKALCRAAENGKDVLVLMELRARFDEENNLAWSKMLEEAGCQVIYGTEGFKCHSKICLITYKNHGRTGYITQIGTGNYNEKTNAMYTDLSLMTANTAIGEDAAAFFRNMLVNKLDGEYHELCVSPFGIKKMLLQKINEQIVLGKNGYICIKANAVTETEVIDKLSAASRAGVEVQLIIRGICCILPGIPGKTDNIHVTSIVVRYLEHSRIYRFGRGDDAELYIASADLMTRNLNRRVEIACPVRDAVLRGQLIELLNIQLSDTAKASSMLPDGTYCRRHSDAPFDSQDYCMHHSMHTDTEVTKEPRKIIKALKNLSEKLIGA